MKDGPCGLGVSLPELTGGHPDGVSPEGIYDLAGNVAEWVSSTGAEGFVRGGSFGASLATDLRTWQTRRLPPQSRAPDVGVRCAYDADTTPKGAEPAVARARPVVPLPAP